MHRLFTRIFFLSIILLTVSTTLLAGPSGYHVAKFGQPPAPTAQQPRPRAPMVPGSFTLLVLSR